MKAIGSPRLIIGGQALDDAPGALAEVAAHPVGRRRNQDGAVRLDAPVGIVNEVRRSHDGLGFFHPGITLVNVDGDAEAFVQLAVQPVIPRRDDAVAVGLRRMRVIGGGWWPPEAGRRSLPPRAPAAIRPASPSVSCRDCSPDVPMHPETGYENDQGPIRRKYLFPAPEDGRVTVRLLPFGAGALVTLLHEGEVRLGAD